MFFVQNGPKNETPFSKWFISWESIVAYTNQINRTSQTIFNISWDSTGTIQTNPNQILRLRQKWIGKNINFIYVK